MINFQKYFSTVKTNGWLSTGKRTNGAYMAKSFNIAVWQKVFLQSFFSFGIASNGKEYGKLTSQYRDSDQNIK